MRHKVILGMGILTVFAVAGLLVGFAMQKDVTISFNDGKKDAKVTVWMGTVEDALAEADFDVEELKKHYRTSVPWTQPIEGDVQVDLTRFYRVTLFDAGKKSLVETENRTVTDLFEEKGITVGDLDEVNVSLDDQLTDDMQIVIDRIEEKVVTKKEKLPFDTKKKEDADLEKGKEVVTRQGASGQKVTKITYRYKNGELIAKDKKVIRNKKPVNKIIAVGTKEEKVVAADKQQVHTPKKSGTQLANRQREQTSNQSAPNKQNNESKQSAPSKPKPAPKPSPKPAPKPSPKPSKPRPGKPTASNPGTIQGQPYSRVLSMTATAYCKGNDGGGRTATGTVPKRGTIAVDPSVIPLGTRLYISGYGFGVAEDTGGAIKGNIIDVFVGSCGEANQWGRQGVKVYILK
ncbi:3D domain-containing protein [Numidum massiliense]|uniref:3D domain-containing protein n=1 Tax=Numidum massiliense TaxID=1522315 RepID=UPI0006D5715B|nr:3D domain-containing protein [Numidum massiliense]